MIVGPANTIAEKYVSFQNVERSAKPIATPIGLVTYSIYLLRRILFFLFFPFFALLIPVLSLRLTSRRFWRHVNCLVPVMPRLGSGGTSRAGLNKCKAYRHVRFFRTVITLRHHQIAAWPGAALGVSNRRLLNRADFFACY